MKPNFPITNWAILLTDEYMTVGRAKEEIQKLAGGLNMGYLDGRYESTLMAHQGMENEVLQNIIGELKYDVIIDLFDQLRDYLARWCFDKDREFILESLIDEYNRSVSLGEQIDKDYLPKYFVRFNSIFDSFKNHVWKYIERFDQGRMSIFLTPQISTITAARLKELPLTVGHKEQIIHDRLKFSITAEQLAVLLRLLHDCNIIISDKGEIHAFVADHVETVGRANQRISAANFGKLFSSKNSDIMNFWIAKLTLLRDTASKK